MLKKAFILLLPQKSVLDFFGGVGKDEANYLCALHIMAYSFSTLSLCGLMFVSFCGGGIRDSMSNQNIMRPQVKNATEIGI